MRTYGVAVLIAGLVPFAASMMPGDAMARGLPPVDPDKACMATDQVKRYRVISDELVRFEMSGGADILMRLKRHCPQLYFHKYVTYTPVNGQLCANIDDIITRSGTPCRIGTLTEVEHDAKAEERTPAVR